MQTGRLPVRVVGQCVTQNGSGEELEQGLYAVESAGGVVGSDDDAFLADVQDVTLRLCGLESVKEQHDVSFGLARQESGCEARGFSHLVGEPFCLWLEGGGEGDARLGGKTELPGLHRHLAGLWDEVGRVLCEQRQGESREQK